ncbi:hypothetical protein DL546_004479 [Coniochaeta pulveracea]|uniref:Uncharacterized protein n=1 Tax=Coniochaeta pulveracea TaxID=177199 RepID=A0A420YAE8_9PEZI|nr:hypothetical protein DL546_004479 [Coniochaeta pulveracea]
MFATQEWQDANRKRDREDEYEDIATGGTLGFTEHRSKRIQALPLRVSNPAKRWPGPPTVPYSQQHSQYLGQQSLPRTITPCSSDGEDVGNGVFRYNGQHAQQQHQLQQPQRWNHGVIPDANMLQQSLPSFCMEPELSPGEDMDMIMDNPDPEASMIEREQLQATTPRHLQAGSLQPDPIGESTITDRMPTPLQPSFAAQVRGGSKNWGGAAGNVMGDYLPYGQLDSLPTQPSHAITESPTRPRAGATSGANPVLGDWNLLQNRRLPSPISEGGADIDDGMQELAMDGSTGLSHDSYTNPHSPYSSLPPRSTSDVSMGATPAMIIPLRAETPQVIITGNGGDAAMEIETTSPSPPRKGHMRSKHTVNNWTLQPGMKKSFSIGYRADCEKCKAKVPGHFNHIIISSGADVEPFSG